MDSSASMSATPDWLVICEVRASQKEEDTTSQREMDTGPSDSGTSNRILLLPASQLQAISDLVSQQLFPSSLFSVPFPYEGTWVRTSSTPATVLFATASSAELALLAVSCMPLIRPSLFMTNFQCLSLSFRQHARG